MSVSVATRPTSTRMSTITIGSTPTGALVNQGLLGGLFGFTPQGEGAIGPQPGFGVERTDGFMGFTPMKAGTTDGAHPTLGHSGSYAYNFTIFDAVIAAALTDGCNEIYLSFDYCPQLLGGDQAPSTVTPFASGWSRGPGAQVPNDTAAFGTIAADFAYRAKITLAAPLVYCGLWNEPDGGYFAGTASQYITLYQAWATAVKAVSGSLKVGGPELANIEAPGYLVALLTACKASSTPVDFISWHDYEGRGWSIARAMAFIAQSVTAAAWTTPLDYIVGEYSPAAIPNWPGEGHPWGLGPDAGEQIQLNDHGAAQYAITLTEAQALGVTRLMHFKAYAETTDPTGVTGGLFGVAGPWAPGNVANLWAKLAAGHVLPSVLDADAGIRALACSTTTDLTGTIRLLVANDHLERAKTYPTTVALAVADGRTTTLWMIDQAHSNRQDAGLSHAALETVPCPSTSGGKVVLPPLAARSVCLLEVAP